MADSPQHVAIIMDGNGRWGVRRGLRRTDGHYAGADAVRRTVEAASDLGVTTLTLFAFGAAQITVLLLGALATTWTHAWHELGGFFTTLSASGLTGLLAALGVVLLAGGFTTMRRLTV